MKKLLIGVLGFQGDIEEHIAASRLALEELSLKGSVIAAKTADVLKTLDGLIIPGGESTVMGGLSTFNRTITLIKEKARGGIPIMGTCSGLIMLSIKVYDRVIGETNQPTLGLVNAVVERNAFGRQRESFEADLDIPIIGKEKFRGIFIRAPIVKEMGPDVQILSKLGNSIVAIQQGRTIGTSFHPELTDDNRLHQYFIKLVDESLIKNNR